MGIIKLENTIVEIKSSIDEHNSKMAVGRKKSVNWRMEL